ncbi:Hypothetical predicted protein [Podarcis lilfordi]|uniref:Uncharacterized protein n=1 Tax=Podarcis lilfordi TaxID=74358 RepID=A0AA35KXR2_9SAUR|nr:Hypothetical predicted protein [Podarcis lilfordi]
MLRSAGRKAIAFLETTGTKNFISLKNEVCVGNWCFGCNLVVSDVGKAKAVELLFYLKQSKVKTN